MEITTWNIYLVGVFSDFRMQIVIADDTSKEKETKSGTQSSLGACSPSETVVHPETIPDVTPCCVAAEEGYRYHDAEGTDR